MLSVFHNSKTYFRVPLTLESCHYFLVKGMRTKGEKQAKMLRFVAYFSLRTHINLKNKCTIMLHRYNNEYRALHSEVAIFYHESRLILVKIFFTIGAT